MRREAETRQILVELERRGLLMLQDKSLPSVVSLLTGETLKGSWWAHPRSHEIFRCLTELGEHPDVLFCKLVAGKVTLVHRRLWPALIAVATSKEPWQTQSLSREASSLWKRVEKSSSVVASGPPVKELERKLLAFAREEHTESGAHRMVIESWSRWGKRVRCEAGLTPAEGRQQLERAVSALGAGLSTLPWRKS
ncbi:MAG: AlkZ-related protein [Thermoanaerobaculia bacterium]